MRLLLPAILGVLSVASCRTAPDSAHAPLLPAAGTSTTGAAHGRAEPGESTPLDRYVASRPAPPSTRLARRLKGDGFTAHVLRLEAGEWLTPAEVAPAAWWHWLVVIVPEGARGPRSLLHIASGDNIDPPPEEADPVLVRIARATRTVVAQIRMVPNQPLRFAADPGRPREEDEIIAYGWDRFFATRDPEWLPRLPMTRSVALAMDALTEYCGNLPGGGLEVREFVVAGQSKRGWTAWTAAAVDDRVVGVVPMVIDLLEMDESFKSHFRAYGFWAPAIRDYEEMGITARVGTRDMEDLRRIVEPIFYRDRLLLPKLVVTAAGDEFFLPDASRLYFGRLGGEKHLRVIPNTGHSLGATDAWETVLAFYGALVSGEPRPAWTWTIREDGSIEARSEKETPERVRLWQATNEQARDFRLTAIGRSWRGEELGPSSPGVYEGRLEPPPRGWTAFFIEATFARAGSAPFILTTEVSVLPRRYPFAWKGEGEGARHD